MYVIRGVALIVDAIEWDMRNPNSSRPALGQAPDPTEAPLSGGDSRFSWLLRTALKIWSQIMRGLRYR